MPSVAEYSLDSGQLISAAGNVEELIGQLEERVAELLPGARNANRIFSGELLEFLTSTQGREFAESLRFEIFERLNHLTARAEQLQDELREAELSAQRAGRIYAFVVAATQR